MGKIKEKISDRINLLENTNVETIKSINKWVKHLFKRFPLSELKIWMNYNALCPCRHPPNRLCIECKDRGFIYGRFFKWLGYNLQCRASWKWWKLKTYVQMEIKELVRVKMEEKLNG